MINLLPKNGKPFQWTDEPVYNTYYTLPDGTVTFKPNEVAEYDKD